MLLMMMEEDDQDKLDRENCTDAHFADLACNYHQLSFFGICSRRKNVWNDRHGPFPIPTFHRKYWPWDLRWFRSKKIDSIREICLDNNCHGTAFYSAHVGKYVLCIVWYCLFVLFVLCLLWEWILQPKIFSNAVPRWNFFVPYEIKKRTGQTIWFDQSPCWLFDSIVLAVWDSMVLEEICDPCKAACPIL